MAGHNKWSKVKHIKAKADASKAKAFTRFGREIIMAAKAGGGDPNMNAALRAAIERARGVNMPMSNIERAIAKGTGALDSENYEEVMYEGYGPCGVAVYIRALTDNRNRTVAELRGIFNKNGATLGDSGTVNWMFERKGVFQFEDLGKSEEEFMELALEAGCDDISVSDNVYTAYCAAESFGEVRNAFEAKKLKATEADLQYVPKTPTPLTEADSQTVADFIDAVDEYDDVQNVYSNAQFA